METDQKKPIEFRKLYNPTSEDFSFMWDSAIYTIKAGESKDFVDYIARHGARKLADKYSKTQSKEEKMVLAQAFLENIPVEEMAERMNVNLEKIRSEVMTKEKERARVLNLESQVQTLNQKLEALLTAKETVKEPEKVESKTYKCKQCDFVGNSPIEMAQHSKVTHKAE